MDTFHRSLLAHKLPQNIRSALLYGHVAVQVRRRTPRGREKGNSKNSKNLSSTSGSRGKWGLFSLLRPSPPGLSSFNLLSFPTFSSRGPCHRAGHASRPLRESDVPRTARTTSPPRVLSVSPQQNYSRPQTPVNGPPLTSPFPLSRLRPGRGRTIDARPPT